MVRRCTTKTKNIRLQRVGRRGCREEGVGVSLSATGMASADLGGSSDYSVEY